MTNYWQSLRFASIEGIEFDPKSRAIRGGHEFGRHRYQGRRGQDTEPTGGAPLVITLVIELFQSVNAEDYPIKYTSLVNVFTDEELGGRVEYVDPVFGLLPMQIVDFGLDENAERLDGGVITVTLEERSTDALDLTAPIIVSRPSARAVATGRALDQALPSAGVFDETTVAAFTASGYPLSGAELTFPIESIYENIARESIDRLTSYAVGVDLARGEVARMRARVDALLSTPELQAPEAWDARRALVVLLDSVEQAALEVIARNGDESTYTPPPAGATAQSVAAVVYGDATRWPELGAANGQIRNPLRLGTTTQGPLRVFVPRGPRGRGRFAA